MKRQYEKEKCPIMREHKIPFGNAGLGQEKDHIKTLCCECPFWDEKTLTGECVYENTKGRKAK